MAKLLETFRNSIIDSIKGRKIGLDVAGYLVGVPDVALHVEDFTTTAAASASPYGITNVLTTGSSQLSQYTLQAPVVGVTKFIVLQSTSTGHQQFLLSGGALVLGGSLTTAGSTMFALIRQNANITLVGLTTAIWRVMNQQSSLVSSDGQGILYTTST